MGNVATTTRPTGRPSAQAAARLGEEMLDAALAAFVRHGFDGTSMEAIARVAGVTKRTLYRHAKDKAALYLAVVERQARRAGAPQLRAIPAGPLDARLRRASDVLLAWFLNPNVLALHRMTIAEAARRPELGLMTDPILQRATDAIAAILAADDPRPPAVIRYGADMFLRIVTTDPLDRAARGIDTTGYTPKKQARAHEATAFFLRAWTDWRRPPIGADDGSR